jgi:hypothetical protein
MWMPTGISSKAPTAIPCGLRHAAATGPCLLVADDVRVAREPDGENPINRYLLNSTMLDDFVRDDDGGITLYLQHESPGKELKPNWLPAPKGPFSSVMRLYLPKPEALDGTWKLPKLKKAD